MEGVTVGPNVMEGNSRTSFIELLPLTCRPSHISESATHNQQEVFFQAASPNSSQWKVTKAPDERSLCFQNEDSCSNLVLSPNSASQIICSRSSLFLLNGSSPLVISTGTPATVCASSVQNPVVDFVSKNTKKKCGWPRGKRRKSCHPTLKTPAPPSTAYVIFSKARRPLIQKTNPSLSFGDVTKIVGQEWSCLPPEQKAVYNNLAENDQRRYQEELFKYQSSNEYKEYLEEKTQRQDVAISELDLYCAHCDAHFVNFHNKEQHLNSAGHRRKVIGPFEMYVTEKTKMRACSFCQNDKSKNFNIPESASVEEIQEFLAEKMEEKAGEEETLKKRVKTLKESIQEKARSLQGFQKALRNAEESRNKIIQEKQLLIVERKTLENLACLFSTDEKLNRYTGDILKQD